MIEEHPGLVVDGLASFGAMEHLAGRAQASCALMPLPDGALFREVELQALGALFRLMRLPVSCDCVRTTVGDGSG